MDRPDPKQNGEASMERLLIELLAMRDAATRLALAMADSQLFVDSKQRANVEIEANSVLERVKNAPSS